MAAACDRRTKPDLLTQSATQSQAQQQAQQQAQSQAHAAAQAGMMSESQREKQVEQAHAAARDSSAQVNLVSDQSGTLARPRHRNRSWSG